MAKDITTALILRRESVEWTSVAKDRGKIRVVDFKRASLISENEPQADPLSLFLSPQVQILHPPPRQFGNLLVFGKQV